MTKLLPALLVSVVLAIAGYALAVMLADQDSTVSIASVTASTWLCLLTLSLANYLLRFFRWQWYMRELSGATIPLWRHILIYFSAFALTTTPGKAGEFIRSLYLKPQGIGLSHSVAGLFVERLVDLVAIVLLSTYALASVGNHTMRIAAVVICGCVLFALPLLHFKPLWTRIERSAVHLPPLLAGAVCRVCKLVNDSAQILRNRHLYGGLVLGVVAWFFEGYGFYLLLQSLNVGMSAPMAIGVYSTGMLAGAVSFMPGGLGGAEAAMALLLVKLGTSQSVAIVATVVCRMATLWFAVVLGVVACLWLTAKKIYPQWNSGVVES